MRTAPRWTVSVNGKPIPPGYARLINDITVKATLDGADELTINATAWDSDAGAWRFVSDNLLLPGSSVTVSMGYEGGEEVLQRFSLVRHGTDYPAGGLPTITIRGYSPEARLAEANSPSQWKGPIGDHEIASDLARQHGLTVTASSIEQGIRTQGRAKKAGTSDLAFLQQLALVNGFDPPWVRFDPKLNADVLYFRRPGLNLQQEVVEFAYRLDPGGAAGASWVRSFRPEGTIGNVPTQVEVIGWDPVKQEPVKVVVKLSEAGLPPEVFNGFEVEGLDAPPTPGELRVIYLQNTSDPEQRSRDRRNVHRIASEEDAKTWATQWLNTRTLGAQTARIDLFGYERLWPSQIHKISGVAPSHAGYWQFVAVEHRQDSGGYTCQGDLIRVLDARGVEEVRE